MKRPCGLKCDGRHVLEGVPLQMNPCVVFDECFSHPMGADIRGSYIFDGILNGFRVVDEEYSGSYSRSNYKSALEPEVKAKMDDIYREEIANGKVIKVQDKPRCVHSLGAVAKSGGGYLWVSRRLLSHR